MDIARSSRPFYRNLTFQVIIAVILGMLLGHFWPEMAVRSKIFADMFLRLIKLVIGPVVFLTIVTGIAHIGDIRKIGRLGGRALIYFEVVTTLALVIGMVAMHLFQPGRGLDISHIAKADISRYTSAAAEDARHSSVEFLLNTIPNTIFSAFAEGNLLQILLVALLFGVAVAAMGERGKHLAQGLERISQVFFGIIDLVMRLAPLGALGAMAYTVGTYGMESVLPLMRLLLVACGSLVFFVLVVLGAIARYYRFSIFSFVRYLKDELWIVFGTGSSESVLPRMMEKMERLGCAKSVVGLVLPAGYSFNLDGSSLYLSMCVLFVAQAYAIDLSLSQQLSLLGIMLLTSKGAAGVAGSAFIVLAATVQASGVLPVEGIALLLGVDRFMSSMRAMTNLIGNGVATVVLAKMEREFNEAQALNEYRCAFNDETIARV